MHFHSKPLFQAVTRHIICKQMMRGMKLGLHIFQLVKKHAVESTFSTFCVWSCLFVCSFVLTVWSCCTFTRWTHFQFYDWSKLKALVSGLWHPSSNHSHNCLCYRSWKLSYFGGVQMAVSLWPHTHTHTHTHMTQIISGCISLQPLTMLMPAK